MKSADLAVGEEYEVQVYGDLVRARVHSVGREERRVYSGARYDFGGHRSNGVVVRVEVWQERSQSWGHPRIVTPQAIKRRWSEAKHDHIARQQRRDDFDRVAKSLSEVLGVRVSTPYREGQHLSVSLTLAEAVALDERLRGAS